MYPRKTVANIDLSALSANFRAIKSLLKPQTKFLASIKANGYGHGAVRLAQELEKIGVDAFGVACLYEVVELRKNGISLPILNMAPTFADEAEMVLEYNYEATVFSLDVAQKISLAAQKNNKTAKIHIKVETGMNRVGAAAGDVVALVRDIKKLSNIEIAGIFTHFADSDAPYSGETEKQLAVFNSVLQDLQNAQIKIPLVHAANSGGAILWPQAHFDMVRVGMSLYGYFPSDDKSLKLPIALQPVMSLKSYVSHVKMISAGDAVSYGCTFRASKPTKIATLAIGYADGVRRTPHNWDEVLCAGKRAKIVGRVCMDQMMIDVSEIENVKVGDEVVLIGAQGGEKIDSWDVAAKAKTSVYEVLTSISSRVTRIYN